MPRQLNRTSRSKNIMAEPKAFMRWAMVPHPAWRCWNRPTESWSWPTASWGNASDAGTAVLAYIRSADSTMAVATPMRAMSGPPPWAFAARLISAT